jgi:hypothetical protein
MKSGAIGWARRLFAAAEVEGPGRFSGWRRKSVMGDTKAGSQRAGKQQGDRATDKALARRVVVAGDVTIDWNLVRTPAPAHSRIGWSGVAHTEASPQPGAAALLSSLISEVGTTLKEAGPVVEVNGPAIPTEPVAATDPRFHHSFSLWEPFPQETGNRGSDVWRVRSFLGLDRTQDVDQGEPPSAVVTNLIILEYANLGFREDPRRWPDAIRGKGSAKGRPWILLKMSCPIADGPLWEQLLGHHSERLIVVMTLNSLRLSDINISRELSWERIAGDLVREIMRHPTVNSLIHCAHVIVTLETGGAVLLSRRATTDGNLLAPPACTVFFDPSAIENSWTETHPGMMVGYASCVTSSIARAVLVDPADPDMHRAICTGLTAARRLHLHGYTTTDGKAGHKGLALPAPQIARDLAGDPSGFACADVPTPASDSWSILESRYPEGLEPVAEALARNGIGPSLGDVPIGLFGHFITVDRGEIEDFRSIRSLIREYDAEPAFRPLNLAVFGPPGAGKSFGVKAVAQSSFDRGHIEELTFNLSQMQSPDELADALHRVRDVSLSGKLPFVFWDEFDTELENRPFGWLRHFLVPMQDGVFQQGQILHPIGKAVFVFAGGTSYRLSDFASNTTHEFRQAKGPDFASRLKGHVDIVGPDPRGGDLEADPYFRIRRALLLRSILWRSRRNLFEREGDIDCLKIDSGVLRAFLEVGSYRHGARSLETIVSMSTLHEKARYERSALPALTQLGAHVDAHEFLSIVEKFVPEGLMLDSLAEAFHVAYCAMMLSEGHPWGGSADYLRKHAPLKESIKAGAAGEALPALIDFDDLPEHLKEQNRDEARELPQRLAALGYVLREEAPADSSPVVISPTDPRVESQARKEHQRWVTRKVKTGWRHGKTRDDEKKTHPCIVSWERLPADEREKDRVLIARLPEIVTWAGLTIARCEMFDPLRVGVTGHRVLAETDRVAEGIEKALDRIERTFPGRPLIAVSALAEGADRLVTEAILRRPGTHLEAILPLPRDKYTQDFTSPESTVTFRHLLGLADEVTELTEIRPRTEAYAAANDAILGRTDVLLAVWDGGESRGDGGTADVVVEARSRRLPIAWVHAGNSDPKTGKPVSLGRDQGRVTYRDL